MPPKKLTLVVGAGASRELGLPTGAELKVEISELLDIRFEHGITRISGDLEIFEALQLAAREGPQPHDVNPYLKAARHIRDALPQAISIDNFLDAHPGEKKMELCGKLAITQSILTAERNSILYIDRQASRATLPYKKIDGSWLNSFFKTLTENCRIEGLKKRLSEVAVVSFNYDRCIEHYLYHALQNYYGITAELAVECLNELEVHHPYGAVGKLPWQTSERPKVDFGANVGSHRLLELSKAIKTFTEGADPQSQETVNIKKSIASAQRVIFLGFAFHRLNMRLISPSIAPTGIDKSRKFFATAKGISGADCDIITKEISELWGVGETSVDLRNDLVCGRIFPEYTRSLSMVD